MTTEESVGITCYSNSLSGFQAILKHRYSDFLVNEVDPDGAVVHLKNLETKKNAEEGGDVAVSKNDAVVSKSDGDGAEEKVVSDAIDGAMEIEHGRTVLLKVLRAHVEREGGGEDGGRNHVDLVCSPKSKEEQEVKDADPLEASGGGGGGEVVKEMCSKEVSNVEKNEKRVRMIGGREMDIDQRLCDLSMILTDKEDMDCIKELIDKIVEGKTSDLEPLVLKPESDKQRRTATHRFFKEKLQFLVTDTIESNPDPSGGGVGEKAIRIRYKTNSGGGRRDRSRSNQAFWQGGATDDEVGEKRQRGDSGGSKAGKKQRRDSFDPRGSDDWPPQRGKFLRFHLYKENKDLQEALHVLGQLLHVPGKIFGFSGTKDKRGVTVQRVTVFKQTAERVAALNARLRGIRVGDFEYVDKALRLGMLSGNQFVITLRDVESDNDEMVAAAAEKIKETGFINYFGLQRFGSGNIPTHKIGVALLRGEWRSAADLILQWREGESPEVSKARNEFAKDRDVEAALNKLPGNFIAERALLAGLRKYPSNFLEAIKCIPRSMRSMYVHSYQSFLWNHAASHRIKHYGSANVVVGDLVYEKGDKVMGQGDEQVRQEAGSSEAMDMAVDMEDGSSYRNCNDDSAEGEEGFAVGVVEDEASLAYVKSPENLQVKHVTEQDVGTGQYTIEDVLLPLPGAATLLPAHETADVYKQMAKKDGIDLTSSRHNVKDFSIMHLSGGYRKLIQKPQHFTWELLKYDDMDETLVETDLDDIRKADEAARAMAVPSGESKREIGIGMPIDRDAARSVDGKQVEERARPATEKNAVDSQRGEENHSDMATHGEDSSVHGVHVKLKEQQEEEEEGGVLKRVKENGEGDRLGKEQRDDKYCQAGEGNAEPEKDVCERESNADVKMTNVTNTNAEAGEVGEVGEVEVNGKFGKVGDGDALGDVESKCVMETLEGPSGSIAEDGVEIESRRVVQKGDGDGEGREDAVGRERSKAGEGMRGMEKGGLTQVVEERGSKKAEAQTEKGGNKRMYRALQLRVTLPTSAYATMLIRELMKTSTSATYHKTCTENTLGRGRGDSSGGRWRGGRSAGFERRPFGRGRGERGGDGRGGGGRFHGGRRPFRGRQGRW